MTLLGALVQTDLKGLPANNNMFALLDRKFINDKNEIESEGKCSIVKMSSIVRPRKEFTEYNVGEQVEARWSTTVNPAEILGVNGK